jgi:hypothetical protein
LRLQSVQEAVEHDAREQDDEHVEYAVPLEAFDERRPGGPVPSGRLDFERANAGVVKMH